MKKHTLHVVPNLDVARVSWASGFCASAEKGGAQITSPAEVPQHAPRLYIGDEIDWNLTNPDNMGYFLAAADGVPRERDNVEHSGVTLTPSVADMGRAKCLLGATRTFAEGFPIDLEELDGVAQDAGAHNYSVGFVGRTDADKGLELELQLVRRLSALGIKIIHLSSTANTIKDQLSRYGVEVAEHLTRSAYLGQLAALGCVINTSPRESLFVSGIEASRMGVPVLAPRVSESGIADWNLPSRFYNPNDIEAAVAMSLDAFGSREVPDVSHYSAREYVARVLQRIEAAREGEAL